MALVMEVGLSPGDYVLDGDPAPTPKGRSTTQFSAHVYCGQTAAWIKMPLGTEVGLATCFQCGPSYPQEKGHTHPHLIFSPCLLWQRSSISAIAEHLLNLTVKMALKSVDFLRSY